MATRLCVRACPQRFTLSIIYLVNIIQLTDTMKHHQSQHNGLYTFIKLDNGQWAEMLHRLKSTLQVMA